ncbi:hypothetical protein H5P28_00945 [Ruficoccus amylovorans]|uniref:Uncharacterized protein n=1 Tax=Ruficoccus amylovorans TaxID=1804625 RepID=A0A842H9N4_9BACT|nr:hypothetical protein [Ruficoccus amylovorans]MBC2592818.1 hypothetical protein [Ruficoccus amylovorans]
MMEEDFYAYEQRAERLRDYDPDLSEASALMQARFEAHGSGSCRKAAKTVESSATRLPAPNSNPSSRS